jgi:tryptophan synthase beta chain
MPEKPDPLINPGTGKPVTPDDLRPVFCDKLIAQELDNDTAEFEIPKPILDMYRIYRPSPLVRAYRLEAALKTPAHIYYKFEGNNTSAATSSTRRWRRPSTPRDQGLKALTTETGAGQWGTAVAEACAAFSGWT